MFSFASNSEAFLSDVPVLMVIILFEGNDVGGSKKKANTAERTTTTNVIDNNIFDLTSSIPSIEKNVENTPILFLS